MVRAVFFESIQRAGVGNGVGADGKSKIVAAKFAFVTDARVDPPDSGVKEEERLGDGLEDVPEEVGTADMARRKSASSDAALR